LGICAIIFVNICNQNEKLIQFKSEDIMAKINIEFHAIPSETMRFIKGCVEEFNLHIFTINISPKYTVNLLNKEDDHVLENIPLNDNNTIYLYQKKPDMTSNNYLDFMNKNPDFLSIFVGKYYDNHLQESFLAYQTENKKCLEVWKLIVKKFKNATLSGAWVINPNNGLKEYYKQHRYTEGARNLSLNGVRCEALVGWNYFILGE